MAKFSIAQFNGGITDYIYKAGPEYAEQCDNLVITRNYGLKQRFGQSIVSETYPRVTTNARITDLFEYNNDIMIKSQNKMYALDISTGYSEVQGYGSVAALYNLGEEEHINYGILNGQIIVTSPDLRFAPRLSYYSSSYDITTAGLPALASTPSGSLSAGGATLSYLYAFVYYRTYTSSSLTFEEYGTPTYLTVSATAAATAISLGNPCSIGNVNNLPSLGNASNEIYNIGTGAEDIKIKIFRTTNNGTIFYDTGVEVDNGTTTASDTTADADLVLNALLYTEGGIADNDEPPRAKYVTIAKDAAWYANTSSNPYRVIQSKRLQPGACPEDFYIDVDDVITGIATSRDFPIVFTENKFYRIDNFIDELGRGDLQKTVVSDRVGCINFRTIVQTRKGVYFAAKDGFYFTDGYDVQKISGNIDETYRDLVGTQNEIDRMVGSYNTIEEKVFFSCQIASDNDILYAYDEKFEAWTTMTGQTDFIPTAIGTINGEFYRGDDEGYIFKFDDSVSTDPVREVGVSPASWGEEAIIYKWKHIALNFGSFDTNKWVNKVTVQINDDTGQHVDIESFDDDATQSVSLKPIISEGLLQWGDSDGIAWGASGLIWGRAYVISKTRRFPSGSIRARYKQLYLTNEEDAVIQYSDASGTATVDATAKTITLDTAGAKWDSKVLNYRIRLANSTGGYNTEFDISARDSDTQITVTDSSGYLTDGSQAWEVIGYKKNEVMDLQAVTFTYTPLSDRGGYYDSSSDSEGNS